MFRGSKKPLEMNDLFDLKPIEEPHYGYNKFSTIENEQGKNTSTFTILRLMLTWTFVFSAFFGIFANLLQFSGPLMIN